MRGNVLPLPTLALEDIGVYGYRVGRGAGALTPEALASAAMDVFAEFGVSDASHPSWADAAERFYRGYDSGFDAGLPEPEA
jgi:hypothetical protein